MTLLHGEPMEVVAGRAVYLAKGERVRWVFPEGGAEYVPICLPGFTPSNVHREDPDVAAPVHDAHTDIYHMVQTHNWEAAKVGTDRLCNVIKCVLNPRFLSLMASYDVASIIQQSLGQGVGGQVLLPAHVPGGRLHARHGRPQVSAHGRGQTLLHFRLGVSEHFLRIVSSRLELELLGEIQAVNVQCDSYCR
jgi:hypothetical protein